MNTKFNNSSKSECELLSLIFNDNIYIYITRKVELILNFRKNLKAISY